MLYLKLVDLFKNYFKSKIDKPFTPLFPLTFLDLQLYYLYFDFIIQFDLLQEVIFKLENCGKPALNATTKFTANTMYHI